MSGKDYSSKQDIAKQFDLPERKSKIATLLKETDVYCICRSSDSTRFMIACDSCEEWYHGDCINITESESRYIKQYFCPPCMEKNPKLEIEYKKAKPSSSSSSQKHQKSSSSSSSRPHTDKKYESSSSHRKVGRPSKKSESSSSRGDSGRCGSCSGCITVVDCYKCDVCINMKYHRYDDRGRKRVCRKRECTHKALESDEDYVEPKASHHHHVLSERQPHHRDRAISDEEDNWTPSVIEKKKLKTTPSTKRGKRQQKGMKDKSKEKSRRKSRLRMSTSPSDDDRGRGRGGGAGRSDYSDSDDDKQCYGLECTNAARKNSKYCSQECCVKLATERLYRILPGRIQEWKLTPSVAEEHNRKDLDDIKKRQLDIRSSITELENKRTELDNHILNVQQFTVDPDAEDDEPEEEGIIHCITCGHEIPAKSCLKHMERCYNKFESQTSFGSIYKTKLEGIPIFCDFYNPTSGTYCKRLAVLCPEHSKEPKIRDTEMCGSPLVKNMCDTTGRFCKTPKKKCLKHFCWEKLRRAELDMERVRNWLKLDELLEQERQILGAIQNRGGVMGLLLHSTFDHDLRNRIQSQIKEGEPDAAAAVGVGALGLVGFTKHGKPEFGGDDILSDEEPERI